MQAMHMKRIFRRIVAAVIFIAVLGPFVWCALISVQSTMEVNSAYAQLLPRNFHWENFLTVFSNRQVAEGILNSFAISLISVAINLVISMPAGFALARVKMPLTNAFLRVVMLFVFVPITLLAVPLRNMLSGWGLQGSYLMVALPMAALALTTLTFWSFYSRFPSEMDDCSVVLGMTPIQGFFQIYLPVSGRVAACAAIMQFVVTWNCAFLPIFMYRRIDSMSTLQDALHQFALNPSQIFLGMVAVLIACLPCWLLYLLRYKLNRARNESVAEPFRKSR